MPKRNVILRLLYPKFPLEHLPHMLKLGLLGAGIASVYGILHDQLTYTLSPEYFTKLKFNQFSYADFGLPERVFVAEIGFLATWWVGLVSAWLLARLALPAWPVEIAKRKCYRGFVVIFGCALLSGLVGWALGATHAGDYSEWEALFFVLDIQEGEAFVGVAFIHNAGYLGGLIGLVLSLLWLVVEKRRNAA